MPGYTNIAKPTGTGYTNVNVAKISYDDSNIIYDDSSTYYDGFNPAAYTNLSKPIGASYTNIAKPT